MLKKKAMKSLTRKKRDHGALAAGFIFLMVDKDDAGANARLGLLYSRRGRPDLAVPKLRAVVAKDPSQLTAKAELGYLYLRGGDPDAALYWMSRMLKAGDDPRFVAMVKRVKVD